MRVSAIITTFNRASLLKEAIGSVLAQTYRDFELIILDNSSEDKTSDVITAFNDSRIVHIRHEPLGISDARNLGVQKARGELVGFLDDDDTWLPNKLTDQVALFDTSSDNIAFIYGGFHRVRSDGVTVYETVKPTLRGDSFRGLLCGRDPLTGSASNPLMRKKAMLDVGGYNSEVKTGEDWEFYLRLFHKYYADFVEQPVLNIRQHTGARLGDKLEDAIYTEKVVMEEFADFLDNNKKCKSYYLQTTGGKYVRVGKNKEGRKYLKQALRANPSNMRAYVQFALSFLGSPLYRSVHNLYKRYR